MPVSRFRFVPFPCVGDGGRLRAGATVSALAVLLAASLYAGHVAATPEPEDAPVAQQAAADQVTGTPAFAVVPPELPVITADPETASPAKRVAWRPSAVGDLDIPDSALAAYQFAEHTMAIADPACELRWTLLAAIGKVESDHGRFAGAVLGADGTTRPAIRGIALDGHGPVAEIRDTDDGAVDGDKRWDRAVGPMQFLPATWAVVGVDAEGDGLRSPDDIDDAALAAAVYLCAYDGSVATRQGQFDAVYRYNHSREYVALVARLEEAYRAGDFTVTGRPPGVGQPYSARPSATPYQSTPLHTQSPTGTDGTDGAAGALAAAPPASTTIDLHPHKTVPPATPTPEPSTNPTPSPTPDPTPDPTPSPAPGPSDPPPADPPPSDPPASQPPATQPPASQPPELITLTGPLSLCEHGFCVGDVRLDLGGALALAATAVFDHDGDGTLETNDAELAGLVGLEVSLLVEQGDPCVVRRVNGEAY